MKKFVITEEEKSRILGMHKSASSIHYLMEQGETPTIFDKAYFMNKNTGKLVLGYDGLPTSVDGINITDNETQWSNNFSRTNLGGRGFVEGDYTYEYSEETPTGIMSSNPKMSKGSGIIVKNNQGVEEGSMIF